MQNLGRRLGQTRNSAFFLGGPYPGHQRGCKRLKNSTWALRCRSWKVIYSSFLCTNIWPDLDTWPHPTTRGWEVVVLCILTKKGYENRHGEHGTCSTVFSITVSLNALRRIQCFLLCRSGSLRTGAIHRMMLKMWSSDNLCKVMGVHPSSFKSPLQVSDALNFEKYHIEIYVFQVALEKQGGGSSTKEVENTEGLSVTA